MPAWERLEDFLGLDDFAVQARLLLADGRVGLASVIFDEAYLDTQIGEYAVEASQPRILGRAADLGAVRRGDRVDIGGTVYDVVSGANSDGTGMATVALARPAA